jgi:ribosomal protein S18 acetylase RimI-like enzyme
LRESEPGPSRDEPQSIRRALPEDVDAVVQITNAAYARYVPLIGRPPQPMTADHPRMIREDEVWLLEQGGEPMGVLELVVEPDCLLIYSVAIRPERQKRGHGRRLLDWAEREARRMGLRRVRLYTNTLMVENIALYRRLGYRETGREPYLGSTILHMSKEIEAIDVEA